MIIDDHTHCHEWSFKKGDPEYEGDFVIQEMDKNGIDAVLADMRKRGEKV